MQMASWNVNGLRACMNKGFSDFLRRGFDLVAVQETKMHPDQADFTFPGYYAYWNWAEKKGYSGTLVLTKKEPITVTRGINIPEHDTEGRVLTLEFPDFYLVNVYTPNSQRELARLGYRMAWEDAFRAFLCAFDKPVVVCGDLNVAHKEIDLANPKSNAGSAGFSPQERGKMTELLAEGFTDTFRHSHPYEKGAYTWWTYIGKAREKNVGWRIDYFLVSDSLKNNIKEAAIYPEVMGSDHCPVGLVLA
ncbi:MAG: exodeoxyribonuclease III [Defluviitaleaceae bacterium]|nr:exodeoxyribonuclease III [Defluviitaleaceae bacterium]